MHIVIAGGNGQVARRLGVLAVGRGDRVTGLVRRSEQVTGLADLGVEGVVLDLERADVDAVAGVLRGADAVVFAAGAGPGSGAAQKDTVDRGAAVLVADATVRAGVRRVLQISAKGVEPVSEGVRRSSGDEVFTAYLKAKWAAEEDLRSRETLDWTILRPGRLTDAAGTGLVELAPRVRRSSVPRDDVAAVLLALIDESCTSGLTLELVSGRTPIRDAVRQVGAARQGR